MSQEAVNFKFEAPKYILSNTFSLWLRRLKLKCLCYCSSNMPPVFFQRLISKSINSKLEFISLCKQCQSFSQATTFNTYLSVRTLKNYVTRINSSGVAKLRARTPYILTFSRSCLGIPATSMSPLDRCIGISLQYSPKAVVSASYKCSWMSCMSKLHEWAGLSKWKWWSCILRWGGQLGIRIQLCGMKKAWYLLIG